MSEQLGEALADDVVTGSRALIAAIEQSDNLGQLDPYAYGPGLARAALRGAISAAEVDDVLGAVKAQRNRLRGPDARTLQLPVGDRN